MRSQAFFLVLFLAAAVRADETLYRYEGDVHPMDPSAGWEQFNPCEPPCTEFMQDGHFVRFWSETGDFANYDKQIAVPPTPPLPRFGSSGASAPTSRWDRSSRVATRHSACITGRLPIVWNSLATR